MQGPGGEGVSVTGGVPITATLEKQTESSAIAKAPPRPEAAGRDPDTAEHQEQVHFGVAWESDYYNIGFTLS